MSERQKKLFALQQRLKASRKANQTAVVAEKRREKAPEGADSATEKRKWFEEKKKRKVAELGRLGLDEDNVSSNLGAPALPLHQAMHNFQGVCITIGRVWVTSAVHLSAPASRELKPISQDLAKSLRVRALVDSEATFLRYQLAAKQVV